MRSLYKIKKVPKQSFPGPSRFPNLPLLKILRSKMSRFLFNLESSYWDRFWFNFGIWSYWWGGKQSERFPSPIHYLICSQKRIDVSIIISWFFRNYKNLNSLFQIPENPFGPNLLPIIKKARSGTIIPYY
jgi:hypothetical protein